MPQLKKKLTAVRHWDRYDFKDSPGCFIRFMGGKLTYSQRLEFKQRVDQGRAYPRAEPGEDLIRAAIFFTVVSDDETSTSIEVQTDPNAEGDEIVMRPLDIHSNKDVNENLDPDYIEEFGEWLCQKAFHKEYLSVMADIPTEANLKAEEEERKAARDQGRPYEPDPLEDGIGESQTSEQEPSDITSRTEREHSRANRSSKGSSLLGNSIEPELSVSQTKGD